MNDNIVYTRALYYAKPFSHFHKLSCILLKRGLWLEKQNLFFEKLALNYYHSFNKGQIF